MQAPVDEVDEAVCEEQEERELQQVVPWEWRFRWCVVQFGVPAYFGQEERCGEGRHVRHAVYCL